MNETTLLPQQSDKEIAALCRVSYDLGTTTDGWIRKEEFDDPKTGFRAAVFQRENSEEYVLAFAGTDFTTATDLMTDARQAFGLETKQYQQAAETSLIFKQKYGTNGAKLTLAGHSLGGGEATLGAAVTGLPAVVINPAGVHDNTLKRHDVVPEKFREEAASGQIRSIIVDGEILDWLNGRSLAEAVNGVKQVAHDKIQGVIDTAADGAKAVADKVGSVAAGVGQAVGSAASHVGHTVAPVIDAVGNKLSGAAEYVIEAATPVVNAAGNVISDTASAVSSRARSAADAIGHTVSGAAEYVVEAATPVVNAVGDAAFKTASAVGEGAKTAVQATGNVMSQAASYVGEGAKTVANKVGQVVNGAAQPVAGHLKPVAKKAERVLSDVADTISDAVKPAVDAAKGVVEGVRDVAEVVSTARAEWNTPMPSSYGAQIKVQDPSGANILDKHRIGVAEGAIDAAITPQQRQAAMAQAFRENPAQATQTYPELAGAHQALEAVKTTAGRSGPKTLKRAEAIIHHKLVRQIEQDKAIPTPQQAIRFTANAMNAARDQGR